MMKKREVVLFGILVSLGVMMGMSLKAQNPPTEQLKDFDLQVKTWGVDCVKEVVEQFELLLNSGKLTMGQLFDTFYVPVADSDPPRYHTQYDKMTDEVMQKLLDKYLAKNERLQYCVIVDRNGYVPTHNTKYQQPLTGSVENDMKNNRAKRIFNDRTGLAAAKNTEPYLLQKYSRDTGEQMSDLSIPVFVRNQHWGAVRIAYK